MKGFFETIAGILMFAIVIFLLSKVSGWASGNPESGIDICVKSCKYNN